MWPLFCISCWLSLGGQDFRVASDMHLTYVSDFCAIKAPQSSFLTQFLGPENYQVFNVALENAMWLFHLPVQAPFEVTMTLFN